MMDDSTRVTRELVVVGDGAGSEPGNESQVESAKVVDSSSTNTNTNSSNSDGGGGDASLASVPTSAPAALSSTVDDDDNNGPTGSANGGDGGSTTSTVRYLKRPAGADDDATNAKKRRKQLKPIKIATNLDDMVKVPKQIIGLNNDVGNVDDLTHAVPNEFSSKSQNSPLLTDVQFVFPSKSHTETSAGRPKMSCAGDISSIDISRTIDKADANDLNVPNIETGPNYIATPHFIFPLSFQPVKTSGLWSESSLRIFNQEAYCDLCKKEFCNKYFLKTHKANKHGIYVDGPGSSSSSSSLLSAVTANALVKHSGTRVDGKETSGRPQENGRVGETDCGAAFCDLCNKKFCNKYFVRRHKSKSHGLVVVADEEAQGRPCHETESKQVQNTTNHSTNETDSTLNLAPSSRENDHDDNHAREASATAGRDDNVEEDRQQRKEEDGRTRRQREDEEGTRDASTEGEQEGPLNLIVATKETEPGDDEDEAKAGEASDGDDDCSSENIEKLQTMLLRLNPSETESKACRVCNEEPDSGSGEHRCPGPDKREKEYLSEDNDSSSESKTEYGNHGKVESNEYLYANPRFDHMKQMKPTSSYCEICNKELCNKYFMRTHMQRMHGIEIEHGAQIGGVVCNICNKELCSKYFLRVHKQNTHGIASPNSVLGPSTSGTGGVSGGRAESKGSRGDGSKFTTNFAQVCYICNKRFRSPKWLQAHFVSDHRDEIAAKLGGSAKGDGGGGDDGEDAAGPATTTTTTTLKVPKDGGVRSAPAEKPGTLFGFPENPAEGLDVISKIFWENSAASKIYNCSQCPFTTSVLAFLFVHERSHYVASPQDPADLVKPSTSLQNLIHDKTFWQHKITQQIPECLDLSAGKAKYVSLEQNGS